MLFLDRFDAGLQLARKLMSYRHEKPFVIALPRGGVVVGYEVARDLEAPLDVLVVRKLGAPGQPELGMGAIAPNGIRLLNQEIMKMLKVTETELEASTQQETAEMDRRIQTYRDGRPEPDLSGKTVIIVDDGLATGFTARAAIQAIRKQKPRLVVLAVPVCALDTTEALRPEVDDLVFVHAPMDFLSVGAWYKQFNPVSDEEVINLLRQAQHAVPEYTTI